MTKFIDDSRHSIIHAITVKIGVRHYQLLFVGSSVVITLEEKCMICGARILPLLRS